MLVQYRETLFVIRVTRIRIDHISYFRIGENRDRRWKSPFAEFESRFRLKYLYNHFQFSLKRSPASSSNSKPCPKISSNYSIQLWSSIVRDDFSRLFCLVSSYIITRMMQKKMQEKLYEINTRVVQQCLWSDEITEIDRVIIPCLFRTKISLIY